MRRHKEGGVVENAVVTHGVLLSHERGDDGEDLGEGRGGEAALVERRSLGAEILVLQEEVEVVEEALLERDGEGGCGVGAPGLHVDQQLHGLALQALLEEEEQQQAERALLCWRGAVRA